MDQRFKTSFIPKRTFSTHFAPPGSSSSTISIFSLLAILIFVVTVAFGVLVFFYQKALVGEVNSKDEMLAARSDTEASFVENVSRFSKRLEASKELLSNHVAITPIFKMLQSRTIKSIRFTDFSYSLRADLGVDIVLSGEAKNFQSVALQSDEFASAPEIKDPVFDGLELDRKGNVLFVFHATLPAEFVSYKVNATGNDN